MSTLLNEPVAGVLKNLFAEGARVDAEVMPGVIAEMQKIGGPPNDRLVGHLMDDAYISVNPEVGRFLYQLVRMKRPRLIVEFGTSLGISAIHMASAVKDNGFGRIISSELVEKKVRQAQINLESAGLGNWVEIRQGDAFETLTRDAEPIDLLLLDGWKELYLPLLKELEPRLAPGAVVVGDDLNLLPEILASYRRYVQDPANGYVTVELPMDDGIGLSVRR